jgi:hypothetical protein
MVDTLSETQDPALLSAAAHVRLPAGAVGSMAESPRQYNRSPV